MFCRLLEELTSPLQQLNPAKSTIIVCAPLALPSKIATVSLLPSFIFQVKEKSAAEVIKEHSDFTELVSKLKVESDLGKYFLSVITPRLGRLPTVSVEKKHDLITKVAEKLNAAT
jgi:hypothetical protein